MVVVGAGGIGLSALKMASLVQAYPVIAVDLADEKLDFARQWGATHTINASRDNPVVAVWDITGKGADYAFDAVGTVSTHESIIEMVRSGGPGADNIGGMAVLIGWPQTEFKLNGSISSFTSASTGAATARPYRIRIFPCTCVSPARPNFPWISW